MQESWYRLQESVAANLSPGDSRFSTIQNILEGSCDLRVKIIAAQVEDVSRTVDGSWILVLKDETNYITAYMSEKTAELHECLVIPGTSVILENVI